MSKELTPLEILHRIRPFADSSIEQDLDIIEKALNDYEKLKNVLVFLKERIRLYNIRGECSMTLAGTPHFELTQEEYNLLIEVLK